MSKRKRKSKKHATRGKPKSYPRGVFEANPRGFGFVKTDTGEFFIASSRTHDAIDGDIVDVSPFKSDRKYYNPNHPFDSPRGSRRTEARVVRIVERKREEFIGVFLIAEQFGMVIPEDPKITCEIFCNLSDTPDIEDGALVKVRIIEYPSRKSYALGKVVEIFSDKNECDFAMERIISRYNLEKDFSDEAEDEAARASVDVNKAFANGYRDIRSRFTFTIDPVDAKDFDDALSLEVLKYNKYRLGVHIADVSAYVDWASPIDLDARKRATSVYLADRVVPMLPPKLSENICSLQPGEDRLCMTVDLTLSENAELLDYDIYPAVMRSDVRLTYDQVQMMLDEANFSQAEDTPEANQQESATLDPLLSRIIACSKLAKARQRARESRGGIQFVTKEAKVSLSSDGKPQGIVVREKTDATQLVEEAMVFANEVVATFLSEHDMPCAYRIHEPPAASSLSAVVAPLQEFKWFSSEMANNLPSANPHVIQSVLEAASGKSEEEMVTMLFLRAMTRAVYSPENLGHYGLGLRCYCHFTSPIRRYPDLIVHRMLKETLGFKQPDFALQKKSLKWLCMHSSEAERASDAAAYDSQKAKMCEYMEPFVGDEFDAVVSGVVSYGLYVRLDNCVEGLVRVHTLGPEFFDFDEKACVLSGCDSQIKYHLGQCLRVKLVSADVRLSRLDFTVIKRLSK